MSAINLDLVDETGLVLIRLLVLLAFAFLITIRLVIIPLFYGRFHHVPGPWLCKITNLHLAFYDIQCRRNDAIFEWHRKYGPVVCVGPNEVSVATIDATRDVYGPAGRWAKSDYFDHFMGYNERSVFATKTYAEHRDKRKLIWAFYQARTIYNSPEITDHLHDRLAAIFNKIDVETCADVYDFTDCYAVDNITYLTMGPSQSTHTIETDDMEREIFKGLKRMQFYGPLRSYLPWLVTAMSISLPRLSNKFDFLLADDKLSDWCKEKVTAAMDYDPTVESDFLVKRLMRTRSGKNDELLDSTYIAAEILDNIGAAEITVAVTATYLIWRLTQHPQWQDRVRDELRALPLQSDGFLAFSDIDQCPVLEACLRETYRVHPAASGKAERVVPRGGHMLSGVYIPEDTVVTTSILALHRDEKVYAHGDNFAPEMWLTGDETGHRQAEAQLVPFGYGPRICLGKALATIEIKMLVAELLLRYQTYLAPSTTPKSMEQTSTHDAVPKALECMIEFRRVDKGNQ